MADEKPTRFPSAHERYLQSLADEREGKTAEAEEINEAPYAVEGNDTSAYVGVSPEYMTYASETEKPLRAEDGPEKVLEDEVYDADALAEAKAEEAADEKSEDGDSTPDDGTQVLPVTPPAPTARSRHSKASESSDSE